MGTEWGGREFGRQKGKGEVTRTKKKIGGESRLLEAYGLRSN